jgi:hypothetical protein
MNNKEIIEKAGNELTYEKAIKKAIALKTADIKEKIKEIRTRWEGNSNAVWAAGFNKAFDELLEEIGK